MFHRFLRALTLSSLLLAATVTSLTAQPCADTQPVITGTQVVSNNQSGVIYSTPSIPGHTYSWSVTGGSITSGGTTSQITVNWGAVGSGSLSLTETNPSIPCSTTVTKNIRIQPLLIAYFYYTNTSCYGDSISFHDASVYDPSKPIVSWDWRFGDGTFSSLQNPGHVYLPPYNVTYTDTLIVTNNEGFKDTIIDACYVNPDQFIPHPEFSFVAPICSYDPVTFNSSASTTPPGTGAIIHYDWNFGDPSSGASNIISSATASAPSHLFSGPGTYTVTLEITNERYCKNTISHQVVVAQSVPTARYDFSSPTCQNNPVFFTDASTFPIGNDIVTWEWYFGDGTPTVIVNAPASPNVSHIFPALGPYTVQLIVISNKGCQDTAFHTVSLTPSPIADFEPGIACALDTTHFQNKSGLNNGPAIVSYHWDYGDPASGNNTSTQVDGQHVYSTPGIYTVTLAIANTTGCPDTIRKTITVNEKPAVEYTWNVGSVNNQIEFHIDSTITNLNLVGYMCYWNFGDGTFGVGHNPVHTYLGSNNWICTLTVTDTLGCSNSVSHVIYVPEIPMAFYSSNAPVCLNDPMCFTDLSSVPSPPFGFITTWVWDFGDGSGTVTVNFPNNPNVCHIYANPGTYTVTLTVTDNSGFSDSYSHDQTVLPLPIANFYFTTGCEGKLVQFTDASFPNGGGNIISWDWLFDDPLSGANNVSNQQNPTHIFGIGGVTYNVRLIIHNFDNCVDTIIKPVYIFPSPPVEFTHDTACLNQLVNFYTNTTITYTDSIVTWQWDFGDGSPFSTDPINTSHLYTAPGIYFATLTVTDLHGCVNSVTHQVKVNPLPIPEFSWSTPACTDSPIQYTDQSIVPAGYTGYVARWLWDFGDGTTQQIVIPGSPNVTHTFVTPSLTHTVRLTVWTSDSCSQYTEHIIYSVPSPIANFTYSTVSCKGSPVQFTDLSQTNGGGSVTQWSWNFGDPASGLNNVSTIQHPAHNYTVAGIYTVTLIIQNSTGCNDTIVKTVTVNELPVADFNADTVCLNSPTQFTDLSTPNAASLITYSWDFGDGSPLSPMQNPTHTYATYGTFNVKLTVVNSNGCTKDTTKQILVNPLPLPAFTFSTPNCFGAVVNYTDLSTTVPGYLGSIVRWVWDFNDGTTTTVNFPASPNVSHTFVGAVLSHNVRLTVYTSDSCSAWVEHIVNSIPAPIANFDFPATSCQDQSVQFNDLSQNNGGGSIVAWSWNFGDPASGVNNLSSTKNPVHFFTGPGTYNVTLIVYNASSCSDTIVKSVVVSQLPVANFTADTVCFGSPTNFTDLSLPNAASIITYTWDFGDGSPTSSLQNPTHTYGTYGIKNVTLTITNNNGCTKDTTKQILVNPLPLPAFSFSTPNCFGAVVNFTNLSTTVPGYLGSIVRWYWDFNDGTTANILFPANPNVSHTFVGAALSHNVRLTVYTNDSCSAYVEHVVNSIPAPLANFSFPGITCTEQSVQFSDLSQNNGGGSIISWNWNFGDPPSGVNNTSSAQNPVHFFSGPGTYTVTLIVQNTSNCSDTMVKTVTVSALPIANFTADTVCLGSATVFTDASIGNSASIITYNWNFGDGTPTSSLQNPTHTFGSYGVFNVTLTVTNANGCIKDTTKPVLVHPLPIPAFSYSTPNCMGAVVQFTNQSTTVVGYLGSIVRWHWDFGDGNQTTVNFPGNPNVTHVFTGVSLAHTVTLTVTTSDSCSASIQHVVNSMASPIASFSFPTSNCAQQSIAFTDLSQANGGGNITQWHWDFGDPASGITNTSTSQNPTHLFSGPGVYTVTEIVYNASNCSDTTTQTITIIGLPTANFTADTVCLGSVTTFTDQSGGIGTITQWYWEFGDGQTSTVTNPTHLYATSGVFNVKLRVTTNEGCVKDTTKAVLVIPKPIASFTTTAPTCAGDSVQFNDLSTTPHGTIVTWVWDFGDGGSATVNFPASPNVSHYYVNGGTYNVKLTITTSDNCTADKTIPVQINAAPAANFDYGTTRCAMMPVQFNDLSQTGGGTAITLWLWDFGDPTSGSANTSTVKNPTHAFTHSGTFNVNLLVTNATGCFDSITKTVTVNASPQAIFTADTACVSNVTQFTDASISNATSISSWVWDFGEPSSGTNNTSTLQNPTHIYSTPGTFSVKLTVTNNNSCIHDTTIQIPVNPKPQAMFQASVACVDDSTQFTDLSIAPGSSISAWYWDFGDGGSATIQNPKHKYTTAATFNVMLRVTNLSGCTDSIVIPVTTRPKPVAAFSYNSFFCPAGQVVFQDQSTGIGAAIIQREWIFEPGSTSSLVNPTYTFGITDTTYLVQLIVTDSYGCMDTVADSVRVKPGFAFTFVNDTVCFKNPTHFTAVDLAEGDSLYNVSWNFGDPNSGPNNISYQFAPQHTFTQPGVFIVKLRATNSDNCTDSIYREVTVHALPAPAFSIVSVPCDSVLLFRDSSFAGSGSISNWIWSYGDGSPNDTIFAPGPGDTSHIYLTQGVYPVVLKVTNSNGCSDTVIKSAEVYPCIFASFTHSDTLMCARYNIAFSDSSLPVNIINQWHWYFGDGNDTLYNTHAGVIYHTFANAGTYNVKLVIRATVPATGRTFVDSAMQALVIHPTPLTYFSNEPVCRMQTTIFKDTSNTFGEPNSSWRWTFGEPWAGSNDTSYVKNPTFKYDSAGVYNTKLVVMNRFGCKDSLIKPTRVYQIPTAIFDYSVACSGNPTYFTDLSLIADTANLVAWRWSFGDSIAKKDTSNMQNPEHQYKNVGDYLVRLIVRDQHGCFDTVDSTVTVHVTPLSAFIFNENVNNLTGKLAFTNESSGADSYFWDFGNGQTSTEENPVVKYANDGAYIIMLVSTNQYECSDTSYYRYEFIFKGLYIPNAFTPASDNAAINKFKPAGINLKKYKIEVFDSWGHMMWSSTELDLMGRPTEYWDGRDDERNPLPSGTYLWKVSATFIDNTEWQGSDIGKGEYKTFGTVTIIR